MFSSSKHAPGIYFKTCRDMIIVRLMLTDMLPGRVAQHIQQQYTWYDLYIQSWLAALSRHNVK